MLKCMLLACIVLLVEGIILYIKMAMPAKLYFKGLYLYCRTLAFSITFLGHAN